MTMRRDLPELDRLIEEGLTLYGQGDLDGALHAWDRALAVAPENPQATSYVEYVRGNYDLLTAEVTQSGRAVPFGIADDEPEYQIEILPGELAPPEATPPLYMDPLDEGWFMEDESGPRRSRTISQDPPMVTLELELEADEPPPPGQPGPHERIAPLETFALHELPRAEPLQPISFDDATREYPGGPPVDKPREPEPVAHGEFSPEVTPGFGAPQDTQTPSGMFSVTTDVRKLDLGFVQTRAPEPSQQRPASDGPPALVMTLRTPAPASVRPPRLESESDHEEDSTLLRPTASSLAELSYEDPPTIERTLHPAAAALLDSLPVKPTTRDLVLPARRPASTTAELEAAARSNTRDFPEQPTRRLPPGSSALRHGDTLDYPGQKTEQLPGGVRFIMPESYEEPSAPPPAKVPVFAHDLVSAPTRDLGIRPQAVRADDEPTNAIGNPADRAGTRSDVYLAFDPIDARTAQILDDVDLGAPANEAKEDRTRRRITTLFEHALAWSQDGELDRSVAAIDLALSEDPNSALAQKLIHRNRDTMMNVFQAFLGDLQRQPVLTRPLHELASAPISPRAAFLLSRVDGTLSLDEILDVSGMPRLEAYRYLCQLYLRGILR
jgi:hypothetical protein